MRLRLKPGEDVIGKSAQIKKTIKITACPLGFDHTLRYIPLSIIIVYKIIIRE
ncbi:MAG: hypothetical protein FWE24_00085 [Defluviitaleaceae bacterium]|nr:hypothetical protein [Defluviitaleaceae bacterium]